MFNRYRDLFNEFKVSDILHIYVENDRRLLCLYVDTQKGLDVEDEIKNIIEMQEEIESEIEWRCKNA